MHWKKKSFAASICLLLRVCMPLVRNVGPPAATSSTSCTNCLRLRMSLVRNSESVMSSVCAGAQGSEAGVNNPPLKGVRRGREINAEGQGGPSGRGKGGAGGAGRGACSHACCGLLPDCTHAGKRSLPAHLYRSQLMCSPDVAGPVEGAGWVLRQHGHEVRQRLFVVSRVRVEGRVEESVCVCV